MSKYKYEEYKNALYRLTKYIDFPNSHPFNSKEDEPVKFYRLLNELVEKEKSPTLEEVKKEWEALGYIWKENSSAINLYGKKYGLHILLSKDDKEYFRYDTANFTFQEHQLLTKTMKALGWL